METDHQQKGVLYCIGVGPGDPELMTLKAVRKIRECQVAAIPHVDRRQCVSYQIAVQAVPELSEKELLCLDMPMTKNREVLERSHEAAAMKLLELLKRGKDVALLTLGDPSVYATSVYLGERLKKNGIETVMVSGVPSFCTVAARLNIPLVKNSEELHILPASYQIEEGLKLPGVKVLMKAGRKLQDVKGLLEQGNYQVMMVENCGMPGERVYKTLQEIPENAGYFSLIIVRDVTDSQ